MESVLFKSIKDGNKKMFERIIDVSYKDYIDVEKSLNWDIGVNRNIMPKLESHMWLYGTKYFDMLSSAQKLEMAWMEVARDVSLFIHFEQLIPYIFSSYINKYKHQLNRQIYEYMMIFEREELTHILMFHRFLDIAKLPWFGLPQGFDELAKKLPEMPPEEGLIFTLFIEWTSENAVISSVRGQNCDPLTEELWRVHHMEEARHIAFGKKIGETFFEDGDDDRIYACRIQFGALLKQMHYVYNFNPEIANFLSFDLPFDISDDNIVHQIRSSEHNTRLNKDRFGSIYQWSKAQGIF
ncbi:MAG: diiron oxygenase [Rhizobiales bacterium]|nr:diiron oxygenase [Hyphomicrobiales bacterium]